MKPINLKNTNMDEFLSKVGLFSKKEAAAFIASGTRHIHSSVLGAHDPCWGTTLLMLQKKAATYPWELAQNSKPLLLSQSISRMDFIEQLVQSTLFGNKSQNRDRLRLITEECLTNAFYHSYKNQDQQDKYDRTQPVTLTETDSIRFSFAENASGINLIIEDGGGSLKFESITQSLRRCYVHDKSQSMFEDKKQGAGLGLYLLFEEATHIKINVISEKMTRFSIWLSQSSQFDPDTFSFNFFEG